jgi:hypothetical protein
MQATRDDILNAAMQLPESDRLTIATRLLETIPDDAPGLSMDDDNLLEELERRFNDKEGAVLFSDLWKQE